MQRSIIAISFLFFLYTTAYAQHVLGVQVIEPGCKVIKIAPHLGDLRFAERTFPTPYGVVVIKNTRLSNGKVKIEVRAPKGVTIIKVAS